MCRLEVLTKGEKAAAGVAAAAPPGLTELDLSVLFNLEQSNCLVERVCVCLFILFLVPSLLFISSQPLILNRTYP